MDASELKKQMEEARAEIEKLKQPAKMRSR
jgi:hypothetical protein